jgi:hypothetical protein
VVNQKADDAVNDTPLQPLELDDETAMKLTLQRSELVEQSMWPELELPTLLCMSAIAEGQPAMPQVTPPRHWAWL